MCLKPSLLLFVFLVSIFILLFSLLTGLSSLLRPSGFWHQALPVGICSLECNSNNSLPAHLTFSDSDDVKLSLPLLDLLFEECLLVLLGDGKNNKGFIHFLQLLYIYNYKRVSRYQLWPPY